MGPEADSVSGGKEQGPWSLMADLPFPFAAHVTVAPITVHCVTVARVCLCQLLARAGVAHDAPSPT